MYATYYPHSPTGYAEALGWLEVHGGFLVEVPGETFLHTDDLSTAARYCARSLGNDYALAMYVVQSSRTRAAGSRGIVSAEYAKSFLPAPLAQRLRKSLVAVRALLKTIDGGEHDGDPVLVEADAVLDETKGLA